MRSHRSAYQGKRTVKGKQLDANNYSVVLGDSKQPSQRLATHETGQKQESK